MKNPNYKICVGPGSWGQEEYYVLKKWMDLWFVAFYYRPTELDIDMSADLGHFCCFPNSFKSEREAEKWIYEDESSERWIESIEENKRKMKRRVLK